MRPSARLIRAVIAERADLARQREHLAREAADLRAALARIEKGMEAIDAQCLLLERLVPDNNAARAAASVEAPTEAEDDGQAARGAASVEASADAEDDGQAGVATRGAVSAEAAGGGQSLRGPEIRAVAVRLLVERGLDGLHYREWFALLTSTGHEVGGKDPLAVFLTQITRSPVVRKGAPAGHYELDRDAVARIRRRIDRLQREYLSSARARRTEITAEIARAEKQLDEAVHALAPDDLQDAA